LTAAKHQESDSNADDDQQKQAEIVAEVNPELIV
jgi:hypothetical protein